MLVVAALIDAVLNAPDIGTGVLLALALVIGRLALRRPTSRRERADSHY